MPTKYVVETGYVLASGEHLPNRDYWDGRKGSAIHKDARNAVVDFGERVGMAKVDESTVSYLDVFSDNGMEFTFGYSDGTSLIISLIVEN